MKADVFLCARHERNHASDVWPFALSLSGRHNLARDEDQELQWLISAWISQPATDLHFAIIHTPHPVDIAFHLARSGKAKGECPFDKLCPAGDVIARQTFGIRAEIVLTR